MEEDQDLYAGLNGDNDAGLYPDVLALYAGLEGDDDVTGRLQKEQIEELKDTVAVQQQRLEAAATKVQELEEKCAGLEQQRCVLLVNMSALFKTAQMELGRKNTELQTLRQQLWQLRAGGNSGAIAGKQHNNGPAGGAAGRQQGAAGAQVARAAAPPVLPAPPDRPACGRAPAPHLPSRQHGASLQDMTNRDSRPAPIQGGGLQAHKQPGPSGSGSGRAACAAERNTGTASSSGAGAREERERGLQGRAGDRDVQRPEAGRCRNGSDSRSRPPSSSGGGQRSEHDVRGGREERHGHHQHGSRSPQRPRDRPADHQGQHSSDGRGGSGGRWPGDSSRDGRASTTDQHRSGGGGGDRGHACKHARSEASEPQSRQARQRRE